MLKYNTIRKVTLIYMFCIYYYGDGTFLTYLHSLPVKPLGNFNRFVIRPKKYTHLYSSKQKKLKYCVSEMGILEECQFLLQ